MNESCHNMTRDELTEKTADCEFNPHAMQHDNYDCSTCHKAHRASIYYCTKCHSETADDLPAGWLTMKDAEKLGASIDLTKTSEAGIKAAVSYINYKSDYRINAGQVEAWARNSQEALAWWEEAAKAGGSESKPYDYTVNCNGHEVHFHANTYFHDEGHQKGALAIGDAVQAEGAEVYFETPCVQLLKEGERVVGAIGKRKSDDAHILLRAAKGVIIAAGDYMGNALGPFFGNSNYPMDIEGLSVGRAITAGYATGRYVASL
ncbi:cytochrome c3 family protein [Parvibacter caecicola]|uniref:cytochrome c3 family protein n=1 Tax=Parvibacter caecicola TaxID=747645 RepID=UPI00249A22B8|nr:cytochrome c3 family protein [Parvibacter caecicola]